MMHMDFKELLLRAQGGNPRAKEEILSLYQPLLLKESMVHGFFDEDVYQGTLHHAPDLYPTISDLDLNRRTTEPRLDICSERRGTVPENNLQIEMAPVGMASAIPTGALVFAGKF